MQEKRQQKLRRDYLSGFLISFIILFAGILFEWINNGKAAYLPAWPQNIIIGVCFAFILGLLHFFYSDYHSVRWLSRVPASISAIVFFTFLSLILGLSIQNNPNAPLILKVTGLDHVRSSFTFLLSGLYLLTTLGLTILRRINKFSYRNIGFLMNHLGLWIIIFAGSLGAGDVQRLNIFVNENESTIMGYDSNRQALKLPFSIKLLDFHIDEFNAKLAMVNNIDGSFPEELENNIVMMDDGEKFRIGDWDIEVIDYMNSAIFDSEGNGVISTDTVAFPIAKVYVKNIETQLEFEDYISCGNNLAKPKYLRLDDKHSIVMTFPEPKEFRSIIELIDSKGIVDTLKLTVNNPVKIDGWELYQLSYDEKKGKYSELSIINAIKDPWLPIIYIGIFMVIAGSIYLFSIGKTPNEELK